MQDETMIKETIEELLKSRAAMEAVRSRELARLDLVIGILRDKLSEPQPGPEEK